MHVAQVQQDSSRHTRDGEGVVGWLLDTRGPHCSGGPRLVQATEAPVTLLGEDEVMSSVNVILAAGGKGERFAKAGYREPKPLIRVLGKPIMHWVLDSLHLLAGDTLHIAYSHSLWDWDIEDRLTSAYPQIHFRFAPLKCPTRGPAESVLLALQQMTPEELRLPCLLMDCDTFCEADVVGAFRIKRSNCIFFFEDQGEVPMFSYLRLRGDHVVEIAEKTKISSHASSGAYGFASAMDLKSRLTKLVSCYRPEDGELFISSVYQTLLAEKVHVEGVLVHDVHCLGTPLQVRVFTEQFAAKGSPLRICFDLDNTLVSSPAVPGDYSTVRPIYRNIAFARLMKELGHTIIIHTARRMKSHSGNAGAATADIARVTLETLAHFQVPFDELYFGKPYADWYVDDAGINSCERLERALGYYQTRNVPRMFNRLAFNERTVVKSSDHDDFRGEVYWYQHAPKSLRCYIPKLVKSDEHSITIERIFGANYSHLFVNEELTEDHLRSLLDVVAQIHRTPHAGQGGNIYENYANKLRDRFCPEAYVGLGQVDCLFHRIYAFLKEYEERNAGIAGVIHGDMVFTNVIVSSDGKLKLIDMRGCLGNHLSLLGDIFYDYAKIEQSLRGYDFILHDLGPDRYYIDSLRSVFAKVVKDRFGKQRHEQIRMLTNSLLFSLIPLHDDPQKKGAYLRLIEL
jgi:capsule biosynthesis phosphatase